MMAQLAGQDLPQWIAGARAARDLRFRVTAKMITRQMFGRADAVMSRNCRWGGWGSNPRPADYEKHGPMRHIR
jgi:hypothetical protein